MNAPSSARRGGAVLPSLLALTGIAVLIALGVWQLERRTWKEDLIAVIAARLSAPPQSIPARERWATLDRAANEYRHVAFPAEFIAGQEALVYTAGSAFRRDISGPGYWIFAPARLAGGSVVIVNRGFVPADKKDAASRAQGGPAGTVDVIGALRWPEQRGLFTPADDPRNNVWYVRDPATIAAAKGWGPVAPFIVDLESPQPSGGLPRAGALTVTLPNNHLQYAITWFGLAAALAGVYLAWLRGRQRR